MNSKGAAVAIVGAGFSGTMVAAHLARRGIDAILVEGGGFAGNGVAFSTREPAHLLNVPAGNMSAWPDEPSDFAAKVGGDGAAFAERRAFGAYLQSILDDAKASGRARLVEGTAVGASHSDGAWHVALVDGRSIDAQALVLATGNQPPAELRAAKGAGERLIANPWGEAARAAIEDSARNSLDVLIIGTGLTMVDVVLSLDSAGHRGKILAVSRRGLIPKSHAASEPSPAERHEAPTGTVHSIIRWLRDKAAVAGWRAAIDSLRPHSHHVWQSLPAKEQARFLRHARPWWDVHRHRIAPQVTQRLDELMHEGRLQVSAGRVIDAQSSEQSVDVVIALRGKGEPEAARKVGYVFNCTGPLGDIGKTRDPLLRELLDAHLAEPDSLSIGLAVDEHSRAGERLWALGTLTKGQYWEIIAVPDIRVQAAAVAQDIATELGR
jgi:uncharacterized NAD(P)/FAD-binding protein YdhS